MLFLGAVAALSRRQRIGPWRFEAGAITPAFFLAALLLGGPAAAILTIVLAYAAEGFAAGGARYPIAHAMAHLVAAMVAAYGLSRFPPAAPPQASWGMVAGAALYWAAWQLAEVPLGWVAGRAARAGSLGLIEGYCARS